MRQMNFARLRPPGTQPETRSLSDARDPRWTGLVSLPAGHPLVLEARARNDVYLIGGSLEEAGLSHRVGSLLCRQGPGRLRAGPQGALLFVYRDRGLVGTLDETLPAAARRWHRGAGPGLAVAMLSVQHHRLMLVAWATGARVERHAHPAGEEIFVLGGELGDECGHHPAGSWMRLFPGDGHSPWARRPSLILLRNGHLRG